MRAAVVLAQQHVLDGLTGASHVHGVGQVRPERKRVCVCVGVCVGVCVCLCVRRHVC